MVQRTSALTAALFAVLITLAGLWGTAHAQSDEYKFQFVSEEIRVGKGIRIEVALTGSDGQPVPVERVEITSTRLDMGPDGMAMMDTPLTPVSSDKPGVFAFETDIVMAGRWALTIEATIEGQSEPVKGEVIYTAVEEQANANPAATAAGKDRKILYYRNPMGLPDISQEPKKDSMGMDYIPVYEDEVSGPEGTVRVGLDKVQRAGVRTVPATKQKLSRLIKGAGMVTPDESRESMIAPKFSGFVQRLNVRTTGEVVSVGDPLLTVWVESPDLLRKQADYLSALGRGGSDADKAAHNLRLFDIPESAINELKETRSPVRTITYKSPANGTVLLKPAIDGMRFMPGDMLFKIADLSTVWVLAEIAEQDLSIVRVGQIAKLTYPSLSEEVIEGTVDFIYPDLDMTTRSGKVRIIVPNADGRLKIGAYAHAEINAPLSDKQLLAIPASAVIDDGTRKVAFVAKGDGLFEPRDLALGPRAGNLIQVTDGLSEGDEVVATGTFLIDAESNLQAALSAFTNGTQTP